MAKRYFLLRWWKRRRISPELKSFMMWSDEKVGGGGVWVGGE